MPTGFTDQYSPSVACGGWEAPTNNIETWDINAGATIRAEWDEWDWGHRGEFPFLLYIVSKLIQTRSCHGIPR
jgi:hypothetical protein